MYLPENNAQMFDILSELRVYAAMNGLPRWPNGWTTR